MSKNPTNDVDSPRKFQFKNIRILVLRGVKFLLIGICLVSSALAMRSFLGQVNARNIETADHDQFWKIAEKTNLAKVGIIELEAIAQRALETNPPIIHLSEEANSQLMSRMKNCLTCENRIVFIELYTHNQLTKAASAALSRSFQLSPYGDLELMQWRLEICNRYWHELNTEQQKAALRQITAIAQQPEARQWIMDFESNIHAISERINRLRQARRSELSN